MAKVQLLNNVGEEIIRRSPKPEKSRRRMDDDAIKEAGNRFVFLQRAIREGGMHLSHFWVLGLGLGARRCSALLWRASRISLIMPNLPNLTVYNRLLTCCSNTQLNNATDLDMPVITV